jgi:Amt family ammonium transporter
MAIAGTFILAFGWFGFNPGSTLAGGDLRIGVVATNTMMAGTAGALVAMIIVWMKFGKPDPGMMVNGMLAGLVAITAPCAFVNSPASVVIGCHRRRARRVRRVLHRGNAQGRRPGGRHCRARPQRRLGCAVRGSLRRRQLGDGWNGVQAP